MHRLLLMITDAFMLEKGTLPYCYFDSDGGFVGSASDISWKLDNWKNEISDIEFEIKYYNASFCLISHSEKVFINGTTQALPKGGIVKLNDNDLISLYSYKIRAKVFTNEAEVVTLQDELSHLLNKQTGNTILSLECYQYNLNYNNKVNRELLELKVNETNLDPLLALKADEEYSLELVDASPHQTISTEGYKFFNPHINSFSEYYTPPDIISSSKVLRQTTLESIIEHELLQNTVSSSNKKVDAKQEELILDPLFFIK
ncbi:hypothetical protein BKG96_09750 [Rodentibacter caecimuris]|uniref:Uncharacterized protein n=1 Tax=Rodentibacter caecimuris TaxID=1796644 RepID=A0A1V3KGK9_9PAST|nr:hypothetical protein [Rodentibacter heylii]OOF76791.1 hypothetical protein BKG96_09750 [Rodentibacter heylii]